MPAILHILWRPAVSSRGPCGNPTRLAGAQIHAADVAVVTAGPNNIIVLPIGNAESRFATADLRPVGGGDSTPEATAAASTAGEIVARAAESGLVLAISVNIIWNVVIGEGVVHLGDRKFVGLKTAFAIERDADAVIVGNHGAVGIERIVPDVMHIPRWPGNIFGQRIAAVTRVTDAHGHEENEVLVIGGHGEACVIR